MLTDAQLATFHQDGFVVLPGFYDLEREVLPIARHIHAVIGLLLGKYGMPDDRPAFSIETFDAGYLALIAKDRRIGGEVYDAVKQIPAFMRLVASERNEAIVRQVRGTAWAGVAAGGYGIRIDNPLEERYRAPWHQEYPAQLRSLDGLVFWSPLVTVTPELGPVQFCPGSHRGGVVRVHTRDPHHPEKAGAYALTLEDEAALIARYPRVAPLSEPGDLIVVDFLTLHASGTNQAARPRWSMQLRYFNFAEPTGLAHGWKGSFAAGVRFQDVHPELVADA
ncbi:MAG: phytanoyl-CoA dioxygenase family protein [Candidatus Sericytochromatia bacterium]